MEESEENSPLTDSLPLVLLEQIMAGLSPPEKKRMRLVCKLCLSTANAGVTAMAVTDASLAAANAQEPRMPNLRSLTLHIVSPPPAEPGNRHGCDGAIGRAGLDLKLQQLQRQFAAVLAASGGEAGALFGAPDRSSSGSSSSSSDGENSSGTNSSGRDIIGGEGVPNDGPVLAGHDPAQQHLLCTWLSIGLPRLRNLTSLSWDIGCRQLQTREWAALIAGLPDGCRSLSLPYHLPPGGGLEHIVKLCQRRPGLAIELSGQGNVSGGCDPNPSACHGRVA